MTDADGPPDVEEMVWYCCGREVWTEITKEREDGTIESYLRLPGGMMAIEFHGACMRCGREWHWSPPEVRLRKILARLRR